MRNIRLTEIVAQTMVLAFSVAFPMWYVSTKLDQLPAGIIPPALNAPASDVAQAAFGEPVPGVITLR